jgi:lipooligosaccharide transport system permease protein
MKSAVRIVQRNALVYRRVWRGSVFSSFLQPTLFLLAMGLGLGGLVDGAGAEMPGGVTFLRFVAPGLLTAACMQTSAFESSWPVAGKMRWHRNYEAMMATPLGVRDLVSGEVLWVAARLVVVAAAFAFVVVMFDAIEPAAAIPAVLAAVLTGVAFSTPILAYAATIEANGNFNVLFRFVITPLFLFSGVFVPVTSLPVLLHVVAWLTPLFHGVELVRGLALGTLDGPVWIIHVAYLVAMTLVGFVAAERTFRSRLET